MNVAKISSISGANYKRSSNLPLLNQQVLTSPISNNSENMAKLPSTENYLPYFTGVINKKSNLKPILKPSVLLLGAALSVLTPMAAVAGSGLKNKQVIELSTSSLELGKDISASKVDKNKYLAEQSGSYKDLSLCFSKDAITLRNTYWNSLDERGHSIALFVEDLGFGVLSQGDQFPGNVKVGASAIGEILTSSFGIQVTKNDIKEITRQLQIYSELNKKLGTNDDSALFVMISPEREKILGNMMAVNNNYVNQTGRLLNYNERNVGYVAGAAGVRESDPNTIAFCCSAFKRILGTVLNAWMENNPGKSVNSISRGDSPESYAPPRVVQPYVTPVMPPFEDSILDAPIIPYMY